MALHGSVVGDFRDVFHGSNRHAREGGFALRRNVLGTKDGLCIGIEATSLAKCSLTVPLNCTHHHRNPITLEVARIWQILHSGDQEFKPRFAKTILFQSCSHQVPRANIDGWRHFLAEGEGKVFQIDPEIFGHGDICTVRSAPADFVHTSGVISKLFVNVGTFDKLAGVRGGDFLQLICHTLEKNSWDFVVLCIDDHSVLVLRKVIFHVVCTNVLCCLWQGLCRARGCPRRGWSVRDICSTWTG